jgi:hypothetical protein
MTPRVARGATRALLVGLLASALAATGATAAFAAPEGAASFAAPEGAASFAAPAADDPSVGTTEPAMGKPYPGDPAAESELVAAEEDRISAVRESANAALRTGIGVEPYRLAAGDTRTLVLVARPDPYTLDELATLAPVSVAAREDGSFLITENIAVQQGATLSLVSDRGTSVLLRSGPDGFVSIVGLGGAIQLVGAQAAPVTVTSWDEAAGTPDTETADGRAYLRVIGGSAELSHLSVADLGFWSGRTGGVSLTGTESLADAQGADIGGASLLPADGSEDGSYELTPEDHVVGSVSGRITGVSLSRNAFGLFVTRANGVAVIDSTISDSLVGGVVFHRDVTDSRITNTASKANALDGFAITRASTGIILEGVTASGNGRNGISLEGGPLAEGPSASGTSVASYGRNEVRQSRISDNAHYGIAVVGGSDIVVQNNAVGDGDMGIVVSSGAQQVVIAQNEVRRAARQGIALRNAGTDARVTGNSVQAGLTGIYARNAGGSIEDNWIAGVHSHGITLVGDTGKTQIRGNTISGSGPSPIDLDRTRGAVVAGNDTDEWTVTRPLPVVLRSIFRPLTVLWVLLAGVLIVTAVRAARNKRHGIHDPYEGNAPLSTFTRGAVPPEVARAGRGAA